MSHTTAPAPPFPPAAVSESRARPLAARRRAPGTRRAGLRVSRTSQLVIAVTVVGALLRFVALGHQSFWYDEALTVQEVRLPFSAMLDAVARQETTPPLYFVIAWAWTHAFGSDEFGIRSLSAVMGVAAIPLAYAATNAIIGRRAAVATAALLAVNPMQVWYAQEARAYAMLVALCALSLWCCARADHDASRRRLGWWALTSAAALATHFFAIFFILPQAVWLLIRHRHRRTLTAVGALAAVELTLAPLALADRAHGLDYIHAIPMIRRLGDTLLEFAAGNLDARPDAILVIAVSGLCAAWALRQLTRAARQPHGRIALPALIAAGTVALPLLLAALGADYLYARNLLPAWLPVGILIAAALAPPTPRPAHTAALCSLIAGGLIATLMISLRPELQRPAWRPVARLLSQQPTRPRAIIALGDWEAQPLLIYLHHARPLSDTTARNIQELDLVGPADRPPRTRPTLAVSGLFELRLLTRRRTPGFTISRYVIPADPSVTAARLRQASSQLFTTPPGDTLILSQTPAR
jgi:4-amino-4-deoxy-L-arabinose transferase-like glycosyltransferase